MAIPDGLKTYLEERRASYVLIHHAPARSAQLAAALLHVPGKQVAKTVALRCTGGVLLALLPASSHVNLGKMALVAGGSVSLLNEQECQGLFPDCQPGAIPPFGELYGLPVYMDRSLADDLEITFCAGTLSDGIRMGNSDFVHLVKPRICSFADEGEWMPPKPSDDVSLFEQGGSE